MFSSLPMKMVMGHGSILRLLTVLRLLPVAQHPGGKRRSSADVTVGPEVPH